MDNLEKIDKFLETYNLPKLHKKDLQNMNRQITTSKIEVVMEKKI